MYKINIMKKILVGFVFGIIISGAIIIMENKTHCFRIINENKRKPFEWPSEPYKDDLGFWGTYVKDGKMYIDKGDICFPCGDSKKNIIDSTEHYYVFRLDN